VLRLIVAELRHRRGRAIALLAGITVATASFTVLTGASESSRLEVRGNVAQHFRTAEAVFRAAGSRRKAAAALRRAGPGPTVARVTLSAQDAYDALIAQLRRPMGLDATWVTGPPRYAQRGARHLVAQPIASEPEPGPHDW
jgi:hypothetical protein